MPHSRPFSLARAQGLRLWMRFVTSSGLDTREELEDSLSRLWPRSSAGM